MSRFLKKSFENLQTVANKASNELMSSYTLVKEKINGLPVFSSVEQSRHYADVKFDEKHYFVIPYHLCEYGFALHTMRCLPNGVPDINKLAKRRVFHFATEHDEQRLKHYLQQSADDIVKEGNSSKVNSLESLANDIDSLDKKLTYGTLLIGGLTAIVNPILGAGIAVKALLPSVGGLMNKYAVRPASEKLSDYQLEKALKAAADNINKEFSAADNLQLINPILQELALSLRTTEAEYDPLIDDRFSSANMGELDGDRWRELTQVAICHVYKEAYHDASLHQKASLGPKDIRWLKVMFDLNNRSKKS